MTIDVTWPWEIAAVDDGLELRRYDGQVLARYELASLENDELRASRCERAFSDLGQLYGEWAAKTPSGANAPYKIVKRGGMVSGGSYAVVNNAGTVKATFADHAKALDYLQALYANVKGAAARAAKVKFTGRAKDRVPMREKAAEPMYLTAGGKKKYPIATAKDAEDAYNLRNHGKGVTEAQVLAHIRRACKALGLPLPKPMRGGS